MDTTGQPNIPAYSIGDQTIGDALAAFVDANPSNSTVDFNPQGTVPVQGDILADFSLRGPVPVPYQDIQKPDITGPGVNIYAAIPIFLGGYGNISGTSMSSPHTGSQSPIGVVKRDHALNVASRIKNAYLARTKSSAGFRVADGLIFLKKHGFNSG